MPIHYFDNNATTHMSGNTRRALAEWCNCGNPSAAYATARQTAAMLHQLRLAILARLGKPPLCEKEYRTELESIQPGSFKVIFTAGASESNALFITSVLRAYRLRQGRTPHMIISAIEHKSILSIAADAEGRGEATVSRIIPDLEGRIPPGEVEEMIGPDTALVAIMHANNETGAMNDIDAIGAIAHRYGAVYYADTAQSFGKFLISTDHIDGMPVSFHKLHGPPGCGALVIRSELVAGWRLEPIIPGSQNYGLRGGTENVPCLGAALCAIRELTGGLGKIRAMRLQLISELAAFLPVMNYTDYCSGAPLPAYPYLLILITPVHRPTLPGTLMISLIRKGAAGQTPLVCNTKTKLALEQMGGVIVSVGSACNTNSPNASHVLESMGADDDIRSGALRISIGRDTTDAEIRHFASTFRRVIETGQCLRS